MTAEFKNEEQPKYVIFKAEDVENYRRGVITLDELAGMEVFDAEVIRHQDIFAAPALWQYAGNIRTAIDLLQNMGAVVPDYLHKAADHFAESAQRAEKYPKKKIPD